MNRRAFTRALLIGLLVGLSLGAPASAQDAGQGVERLGGVEPPDPRALAEDPAAYAEQLAAQGLLLDLAAGAVNARGGTLHDTTTLGYPIEYLMVTDRGRTHESLFVVKAQPSVLDACLRALGVVPGHPMRWVLKDPQPSRAAVDAGEDSPWEAVRGDGPLIAVDVAWTDDEGRPHRRSLESMLLDVRTGEALPELDWIYTGSGIAPLRQGRQVVRTFVADLQGDVIAIYLTGMGAALLERNSIEGIDDSLYTINPANAPKRGTPVTLIFRPTGEQARAAPPPGGQSIVSGELGTSLDEWLTRAVPWGSSGVVCVARDGEVLLHKGYGLADVRREVPYSVRTVFALGEMSGLFVRTALKQLEQSGALGLDDVIARHLDGVPEDKAKLTVRDLLEHTSRLPHALPGDPRFADLTAAVEAILAAPLRAPGAERPAGDDKLAQTLLIAVIESAAGMRWGDVLAEHVFGPAEMIDSGVVGEPRWAGSQIPADHAWPADGQPRPSAVTQSPTWPGTGLATVVSSLRDLQRYARALRDGTLAGPDAADAVLGPLRAINDPGQQPVIGRLFRGGDLGHLVVWRSVDDVDVWIAGDQAQDIPALGRHLLALVAGKPLALPPSCVAFDTQAVAGVEGVYVHGDPVDERVLIATTPDDKVRVQVVAGEDRWGLRGVDDLRPISSDTWGHWDARSAQVTMLRFHADAGDARSFSICDPDGEHWSEFRYEDPVER